MASIYLLIPLAVIMLFFAIWLFFWAVNNKQFDDLDSPSQQIIMDDKLERLAAKKQRSSEENSEAGHAEDSDENLEEPQDSHEDSGNSSRG